MKSFQRKKKMREKKMASGTSWKWSILRCGFSKWYRNLNEKWERLIIKCERIYHPIHFYHSNQFVFFLILSSIFSSFRFQIFSFPMLKKTFLLFPLSSHHWSSTLSSLFIPQLKRINIIKLPSREHFGFDLSADSWVSTLSSLGCGTCTNFYFIQ